MTGKSDGPSPPIGYGSSLKEASQRCSRCGGTGLVAVTDPGELESNLHEPGRLGHSNQ